MKKDQRLQKIVEQLVQHSTVARSIKILKSLPRPEAIWAMSEYLKILKRQERAHTMYLETVIPLSLSQINKVKKIIEKRIKINKVITQVNPQILGGFKLRVGDEVWDETLLNKIHQVKEVISGRFNQTN